MYLLSFFREGYLQHPPKPRVGRLPTLQKVCIWKYYCSVTVGNDLIFGVSRSKNRENKWFVGDLVMDRVSSTSYLLPTYGRLYLQCVTCTLDVTVRCKTLNVEEIKWPTDKRTNTVLELFIVVLDSYIPPRTLSFFDCLPFLSKKPKTKNH